MCVYQEGERLKMRSGSDGGGGEVQRNANQLSQERPRSSPSLRRILFICA
jgi:hypothetical protein